MPRGRKQIVPESKKEINYTLMGAVDEEGFIGYMIMEKGAQQEQFMGFIAALGKKLENDAAL